MPKDVVVVVRLDDKPKEAQGLDILLVSTEGEKAVKEYRSLEEISTDYSGKIVEKMAQAIVDNIHRGVTLIDSQGWYTKKESKIVMVVCRKRETTMILKFVKTIDPEAFMTVGSVMGVYGKGFQAISKP